MKILADLAEKVSWCVAIHYCYVDVWYMFLQEKADQMLHTARCEKAKADTEWMMQVCQCFE